MANIESLMLISYNLTSKHDSSEPGVNQWNKEKESGKTAGGLYVSLHCLHVEVIFHLFMLTSKPETVFIENSHYRE